MIGARWATDSPAYFSYGQAAQGHSGRALVTTLSDLVRCRTNSLVGYQTHRHLSGWDLRPLMIGAVGAHSEIQARSL